VASLQEILMRNKAGLLSLIWLTIIGLAVSGQEKSLRDVYREARKGVVLLVAFDENGEAKALGSGVILTPEGEIATNLHVVRGAKTVSAKLWNGTFLPISEAIGVDAGSDLVVLKADALDLPAVRIAQRGSLAVGDTVLAIGNPMGLESALSTGVVSGFRDLAERGRVIQTTAPISPGSSGGGLFDQEGGLVGITSTSLVEGQNVNFAIPVEAVVRIPRVAPRKLEKLQERELGPSGSAKSSSGPSGGIERAKKYLSLDMLDDAEQELTRALADDKFNPEVHFYLGVLFTHRKNYEKARGEFKISNKLDSQALTPWMSIALVDIVLLQQQGGNEYRAEALECLRHAQRLRATITGDRYSDAAVLANLTADIEKEMSQLLNVTGAWAVPHTGGEWKFEESEGPRGMRLLKGIGPSGNIRILQAGGPEVKVLVGFMWRTSDLDLEGWFLYAPLPIMECNSNWRLVLRESDDGLRLEGTQSLTTPEKTKKGCSYTGSFPVELIRQ